MRQAHEHTIKVVAAMLMSMALCSCHDGRSRAVQTVERQISTRQADMARAMQLYRKGLEAHEASHLDKAHKLLSGAVAADKRNASAWMALGAIEFERDSLFKAAEAFHRACRLEPRRYEPHFNVGTILESAGRYQQAVREYEIALELAPDQIEVMENLARCYIKLDTNLDKAKKLVDRALTFEARSEWRLWLMKQSNRLSPKQMEE